MGKPFDAQFNGTIPNGALEEFAWDYLLDPDDPKHIGLHLPLRAIRETSGLSLVADKGLFVIHGIIKARAIINTYAVKRDTRISKVSLDLWGTLRIQEQMMNAHDTELQIRTEGGSREHYYRFAAHTTEEDSQAETSESQV